MCVFGLAGSPWRPACSRSRRGASLALSPEVRMRLARRLPASSILLTRDRPSAARVRATASESDEFFRVVDLLGAVGMPSTMVEERCSNSPVMRSIRSFSISWTIGEIDELVVDVAGLELRLVVSRSGGVEHGARGFGAGFFQAVEQVAATLRAPGSVCRRDDRARS